MRRIIGFCALAAVMSGSPGCGSPMLHPASTPETRVADPGIVGEWTASEPMRIHAVIDAAPPGADGPAYTASLTIHDKGEFRTAIGLDVSLTMIGASRFVDLFLARPDRDRLVNTYGFLVVPVHQVMKFDRDADTLTVRPFRGDWLESQAEGAAAPHDRVAVGGGEVVMMTATTERLREFLLRHADDPRAFGDPVVFHRVRN